MQSMNHSTVSPASKRQLHNDRVRQRLAELVELYECVREVKVPDPKKFRTVWVENGLVFAIRQDGSLVDPFTDPGIKAA